MEIQHFSWRPVGAIRIPIVLTDQRNGAIPVGLRNYCNDAQPLLIVCREAVLRGCRHHSRTVQHQIQFVQ